MTAEQRLQVRLLWLGLLAGPVAWSLELLLVYALAAWACNGGPRVPMHLGCALCLLLAVGGGVLAWRQWRTVGGWPTSTDDDPVGRFRLMALVGVLTGTLFSLVILAQWIAAMMLPVCPTGAP